MFNKQTTVVADKLRSLGMASIIFFTVKGLLWLSLPALLSGWATGGWAVLF